MEILASVTVTVGIVASVCIAMLRGFPVLFAVVICLQSVICLCLENCDVGNKKNALSTSIRSHCGSGVYCAQLAPVAVIMCSFYQNIQNVTDPYWMRLALICISLTAVCLAVHLSYIESERVASVGGATGGGSFMMPLATWFLTMVPLFASLASHGVVFSRSDFIDVLETALVTGFIQAQLPRFIPRSLSLGEAALIANGSILLFYAPHAYKQAATEETYFLHIAGVCCILVALISSFVAASHINPMYFYGIVVWVIFSTAIPLSMVKLKQNFVFWIIDFITKDNHRLYLFVFWGASCAVAVTIVTVYYHVSSSDQSQQTSTAIRKVFHVLAVCVYLPGILVDVQMTNVAASCALIVFVMLEVVRKLRVWPLGGALDVSLRVFTDSRDSGPLILTHLYLLAGFSVPLWLGAPSTNMNSVHVVLLSAVLSLGVGDTAASLIGSRFGAHHWPGSNKTIEGTCACALLQLITMVLLTCCVHVHYTSWLGIGAAIVMTSLLEAFTTQIDNIVLPVFMHTLLLSLQ